MMVFWALNTRTDDCTQLCVVSVKFSPRKTYWGSKSNNKNNKNIIESQWWYSCSSLSAFSTWHSPSEWIEYNSWTWRTDKQVLRCGGSLVRTLQPAASRTSSQTCLKSLSGRSLASTTISPANGERIEVLRHNIVQVHLSNQQVFTKCTSVFTLKSTTVAHQPAVNSLPATQAQAHSLIELWLHTKCS